MVRRYDADEIPAVYNVSEMPVHEREPGVQQRYFRGLDTLAGFTRVTSEREEASPHSHPWEQLCFIVDGACDFHVGDETVSVEEGDIFFVPPDTPHYSDPPEDECTIMFFGPLREDYAERTAYQTEF